MPPGRGLISAFKGVTHLATALVLVQALLAGFFISGEEPDAKDAHEMAGNALVVIVLAQLALAYLVRGWGRFKLLRWVAVLAVLVFVQLGLGMASKDESIAETIHIPLGVLLFGLGMLISALAYLEDRLPQESPE